MILHVDGVLRLICSSSFHHRVLHVSSDQKNFLDIFAVSPTWQTSNDLLSFSNFFLLPHMQFCGVYSLLSTDSPAKGEEPCWHPGKTPQKRTLHTTAYNPPGKSPLSN
ncbi:hypothetical protein ATANTOWER_026147 [Ataeniobius toweri]|uniref:Uncharacterized protein n=1 Tax=Ataeniobius toweri TaxID=208326 RepID=A0ABU7AS04_9TELE|nr:hypothetical protein [Ataeniobius toweri]